MTRVNVAEAKARLSGLIDSVLAGEDVVISRRNQPLVRLTALQAPRSARRLGWARGAGEMSADFDRTPDDFASYATPRRRRRTG